MSIETKGTFVALATETEKKRYFRPKKKTSKKREKRDTRLDRGSDEMTTLDQAKKESKKGSLVRKKGRDPGTEKGNRIFQWPDSSD